MQIIVKAHTIELNKTIDINSGEYNIQECEFEFSNEYDGLTKMAIFSNEDESFETIITDNKCIIPYEILENDGTIALGVYGYEVDGDNLVKRYSPKPVFFNVELGSYQLAQESLDPSSDIISQILQQLENQAQDIITLENNYDNLIDNVIPTLATKEEIPTKTSQLQNDSNFAYESDIPDVSGFITKDVNDLTYYTKTSDLSSVALSGNYNDLLNKPDLSGFITKSVNDLENYYLKSDTYTQAQVNDLISAITTMSLEVVQTLPTQDISTTTIYLVPKQTPGQSDAYDEYIYVNNNWEHIGSTEVDLTNYVKNTDYATSSKGGVIKSGGYGLNVNSDGTVNCLSKTYQEYQALGNTSFIGKGTLENVITGKDLTTKSYVDGLVGDINTALDTINGEVI